MLKFRDGTKKRDNLYLLTQTCIKPTNKLVNSLSGAPLMLRQAMATLNSQDSPWAGLGGSHHLPPYSILCVFLWHLHSNDFLSRDSQGKVPKMSQFGLLGLCKLIIFCLDFVLRLGRGLKQIYSSP
jgi:hypothetical protein